MKWCRIELESGPAYGLVEGAEVAIVDGAPFERHERTGARYPFPAVKLLPPVTPPNFYAAGINYRAHIDWANSHHGMTLKPPEQADIGYRSANALIGSGADIVVPAMPETSAFSNEERSPVRESTRLENEQRSSSARLATSVL